MYCKQGFRSVLDQAVQASGVSIDRIIEMFAGISRESFERVVDGKASYPDLYPLLSCINEQVQVIAPEHQFVVGDWVSPTPCTAALNQGKIPGLTRRGKNRIRRALRAMELRGQDLADELDISLPTVSFRLNGRRMPKGGEREFDQFLRDIEKFVGLEEGALIPYKTYYEPEDGKKCAEHGVKMLPRDWYCPVCESTVDGTRTN